MSVRDGLRHQPAVLEMIGSLFWMMRQRISLFLARPLLDRSRLLESQTAPSRSALTSKKTLSQE